VGGIVFLLAGFATLVTYLANRGFFTVEMGIAGAALAGLSLLILGWGFRKKRPLYFLLLQGGGIGILYFSVFAAHKLTPYFPPRLSLVLMSILIPPALVLALLQNSQALALLGFLGGFAAPLLMAFGRGNQIFLFAYYLVLDLGVLCIGFFRRWGALNLLAFLFSFILAIILTLGYYEPGFFWSAEPFFLAYIAIFTVLGFRGFDGGSAFDRALVLGTPILGALLQWKVFESTAHGHALICVVFSVYYILLALIIRRRRDTITPGRRILFEIYLAFAVLLANLALPLELAPRITSALWAAEALVVFVFGLRLKRIRIIAAALVLHAAGAIAFFFEAELFSGQVPFPGAGFTGSLIIALSALVMLYFCEHPPAPWPQPPALPAALGIWAFVWWFGGWAGEFYRVLHEPAAALFTLCSVSALVCYGAALFLRVPLFRLGIIPSLAGGTLSAFWFFMAEIPGFFTRRPWMMWNHNFFRGPFLWAWLIFFAVQGLLLFCSRRNLRENLHGTWIAVFVCTGIGVLSSSGRFLALSRNLAPAWISFAGLLPVFFVMAALSAGRPAPAPWNLLVRRADRFLSRLTERQAAEPGPPDGSRRRLIFYTLPLVLSCVLGLWFIVSLFLSGDPAPLPFYIPLINPLDLEEAFCIVLLLLWQSSLIKRGDLPAMKKRTLFISIDAMIFLFAIALCARSVHFYGQIPYRSLIYSDVFHLFLFILWAVYGLGHVIAGSKMSLRQLWIAGALLMVGDIAKFILLDLAKAGTALRIVSFFVAGLLLLFIGWAAPLPPSVREGNDEG
jgi:uncharacterized membrane protein